MQIFLILLFSDTEVIKLQVLGSWLTREQERKTRNRAGCENTEDATKKYDTLKALLALQDWLSEAQITIEKLWERGPYTGGTLIFCI